MGDTRFASGATQTAEIFGVLSDRVCSIVFFFHGVTAHPWGNEMDKELDLRDGHQIGVPQDNQYRSSTTR